MVKVNQILQLVTYLAVAISYASVYPYVEKAHSALFALLVLVSIYLSIDRPFKIPRWLLNSISIFVLLLSSMALSADYLVEPVLGALVILTGIKLLEEKTFRDYAQIFAMCVFLLVGSCLLSLDISFLAYFFPIAVLSTAALMLLAFFSEDSEIAIPNRVLGKILLQSFLICAIALPGCLLFFIILPRTNYPILSFLNKNAFARTGFTDSVRLGEISEIQEDNNVIFRAKMPKISPQNLYWRGIILDEFNGTEWRSSKEDSSKQIRLPSGPKVSQTIYLEPYGNRYLFALDKPQMVLLRNVQRTKGLTYLATRPFYKRIKYEVVSILSDVLLEEPVGLERYLQIPKGFSPRIREFVKDHFRSREDTEIIKSMLNFIKSGNYLYSIDSLPHSKHPLEDFLFKHKKGNCEYFASSMAVMLRMAGVPARLIGGYKGGHYNRAAGYYLVLQSNAHVWVEAYVKKVGWIRIDPTAYSATAPPDHWEKNLIVQFKVILDTFNYYWYRFIINYDFSRQLSLLKKVGAIISKPHLTFSLEQLKEKTGKFAWIALLPLIFAGVLWFKKTRRRSEKRVIDKFHKRMRRYGYERDQGVGLEEFALQIEENDLKQKALEFVQEFESIYYRDQKFTKDVIKVLEKRIVEL